TADHDWQKLLRGLRRRAVPRRPHLGRPKWPARQPLPPGNSDRKTAARIQRREGLRILFEGLRMLFELRLLPRQQGDSRPVRRPTRAARSGNRTEAVAKEQ